MCGIYGTVAAGASAVAPDLVVRATRTLTHRGPDDEGFLFARATGDRLTVESFRGDDSPPEIELPHVTAAATDGWILGLGHRRLAILDLSPAGHQPMSDAAGEVWTVFNGEIYNYVELRDELGGRGHSFHTGTDTEVLLAAYREWGLDFITRLNGMWAFLLIDTRQRTLIGARDRFGIKPLFWRRTDTRIEFASEIKALLAVSDERRTPNERAVCEYLASGSVDVPPHTFFADIWQVPPAHLFVLPLSRAPELRPERYWSPPGPSRDGRDPTMRGENAVVAVRETLRDAVRLCLRSDVPVGSCLSGGLDSSSIVSLMSECVHERGQRDLVNIHTFSSCFDDPRLDERQYAEQVVVATRASSTLIFPDGEKLIGELDDLVRIHDEPLASTSPFAQAEVFAAARRAGMTVMLDGQGGDELFAGYLFFHPLRQLDLLSQGRVVPAVGEWLGLRGMGTPVHLAARQLISVAAPTAGRQLVRRALRREADEYWIAHSLIRRVGSVRPRESGKLRMGQALHQLQVESLSTLLPALLRYEDRNSMARSIEARVPFLDHRLVELAFRLPDDLKIKHGVTKHVLREAMRGIVPGAVLARADKMGFVTPQVGWMRLIAGRDAPSLDERTLAYVAAGSVERLRAVLRRPESSTSHPAAAGALWRILCLDAWIRTLGVEVR